MDPTYTTAEKLELIEALVDRTHALLVDYTRRYAELSDPDQRDHLLIAAFRTYVQALNGVTKIIAYPGPALT